jgi:hypothetical protein
VQLSDNNAIVKRTSARKDAPDRVVILASVVGQFSRNLATGSTGRSKHQWCQSTHGRAFGSAPTSEVFNKVEVGHVARSMLCARAFCRLDRSTALTLAPCSTSCFAR